MSETYIPLIKRTKWVDLSDEHEKLRKALEGDLAAACCEQAHIQPIMLQGAFGIGKSTTLYYLFHYGWEILKTPTFYFPLSKIVDRVKEVALQTASGKVPNDRLSAIIQSMVDSQLQSLRDSDWNTITNLDFPEFKSGDGKELSLSQYLEGFTPIEVSFSHDRNIVFSEEVIREALQENHPPIILVDEFESKFYELKKYVESSGGGILRELFDQVVQSRPFILVIGNGPASGYEVAKERGSENNDSETAANRRLKTMQIPFPTVKLLKQSFMKDCSNGYVNFIWWLSRCRPGHIQKLHDAIDYDMFSRYDVGDFFAQKIFKQPIDESGEEVQYLKTQYFNDIESKFLPAVPGLLLDFEPRQITIDESLGSVVQGNSHGDFYYAKKLVRLQNDLLPALQTDVQKYLKDKQSKGLYTQVDYITNIHRYFNYILSACANQSGEIAFSVNSGKREFLLATSFLVPLLELTYDFVSQYEDDADISVRETKDFILDCTKYIEKKDVEGEYEVEEKFEETFDLFEKCRCQIGDTVYCQFSLKAIREFIEQPIGSPRLKYKSMDLELKLQSCSKENPAILLHEDDFEEIIFVPHLDGELKVSYLKQLKKYLNSIEKAVREEAKRIVRVVWLDDAMIDGGCEAGLSSALLKLKKISFSRFDEYQFNFGGQIADYIDSIAKIAIIGVDDGEIAISDKYEGNEDFPIVELQDIIDRIKTREWTKQKEVARTIEHYAKLVRDGNSSVFSVILKAMECDYRSILESLLCPFSDYGENIEWDFNEVCDSTEADQLSRYVALSYLFENAGRFESVDADLMDILKSIGSRDSSICFDAREYVDGENKSLNFCKLYSILTRQGTEKIMRQFDVDNDFTRKVLQFVETLSSNTIQDIEDVSGVFDLMGTMDKHWISSYNEYLSESYATTARGDVFFQLSYLHVCVTHVPNSADWHERIAKELQDSQECIRKIRGKLVDLIENFNALLDSKKPVFEAYSCDLREIDSLIVRLRKLMSRLDMNIVNIPLFLIVDSILFKVRTVLDAANRFCNQFESLCAQVRKYKDLIKEKYQDNINSIYSDSLTAKLITLENNGTRYDGAVCWKIFRQSFFHKNGCRCLLDAVIRPVSDGALREDDVTEFVSDLEETFQKKAVDFEEMLKKCENSNEKSRWIKKIEEYIEDLLK